MSAPLVETQPVAKVPGENRGERPFLTVQWRQLAMFNYEIDPAVLAPHVPAGTELDRFHGATYVSLVGFLFRDTRIRGWAVPFHRNFEEVNLRFYVRRRAVEGWRRGIVFIRELVRLPAVSLIARWCFQENFLTVPMWHSIHDGDKGTVLRYGWQYAGRENSMTIAAQGMARVSDPADTPCSARVSDPVETPSGGGVGRPAPSMRPAPSAWQPLEPGTLEEFVAEHYWGYSAQRDGTTKEYRVAHPSWRVRPAVSAHLDCAVATLYGPQFAEFLTPQPTSAFLAEGSAVELFRGFRIANE